MSASRNASIDVTDFVNSFARKRQLAEPTTSPATALPVDPETTTPVLTAPETSPAPALTIERADKVVKSAERIEHLLPELSTRINYAEAFLTPIRDRKVKAVYITEDAHRTLNAISQASDGTPLADLLGNIISHHFETHGNDIRAFMAEQERKNKKRLLI